MSTRHDLHHPFLNSQNIGSMEASINVIRLCGKEDNLVSYPNFIRGQLFVDMQIFAGHVEMLNANCRVIHKISQRFGRKMSKNSKWG